MIRRARTALLVLAPVILSTFVYWALFSNLGVFILGNHYWLARAVRTEDPAAAAQHFRRVLSATQYGVNQAESAVMKHPDPAKRVQLWNQLIRLAPNDHWRRLYGVHLKADLERVPPSKK